MSISAFGRRVEGVVSSADPSANTITVALDEGGGTQTYAVATTSTISVDGAAGLLSGIAPGSDVQLRRSASVANTVIGIEAETGNGGSGDQGAAKAAAWTIPAAQIE